MSRAFDDALSQYISYGGAVLSDYPLTLSAWFNSDDSAGSDSEILVSITEATTWGRITLRLAKGTDTVNYNVSGTGSFAIDSSTTWSVDTWHHALSVSASSSSHAVYLDGGGKATSATNVTLLTFDSTNIGINLLNNSELGPMSGNIAEVAIWNAALTDDEAAILAAGYSPLFVRPGSLISYWPLIRDEDQDRVGGYNMTAYNTPSIAAHPPVIYPAQVYQGFVAAVAAGVSIPVFMHHYRQQGMT